MALPPTWRGKPLSDMSALELAAAEAFCAKVKDELAGHAPPAVWSFFTAALADITVERVERLRRLASVVEPTTTSAV